MNNFLQNKFIQKESKTQEQKMNKIEQAKSLLFNILEIENNEQIKKDINESIIYLNFLIIKIKNPTILSPRETLLNEINSKIHELSSKFDNLEKKNIKNNINLSIIPYNIPLSPKVVIKPFKSLEESIHNINNKDFQEV